MHVCWLLVANEDINTWHATTTSSLCKLEMNSVAIAFDGTRAVQLDALVRGSGAWVRRLPYQIMIKAIAMDMVLGRVARAVGEALWQTNAWVGKAKGGMGWRRPTRKEPSSRRPWLPPLVAGEAPGEKTREKKTRQGGLPVLVLLNC